MTPANRANEWKKHVFEKQKDMMRSLHLDYRTKILSPDDAFFEDILNPKKIEHRGFYPFIEFTKVTKRYKKTDDGTARKIDPKQRELCYASHQDSLVYSWYARLLGDQYEEYIASKPFNASVIAYRRTPRVDDAGRGKSNIHFAMEVFSAIVQMGDCTILTFDIKNFFPTIDHIQLKELWCEVLDKDQLPEDHYAVFRSLTKSSFVKYEDLLEAFGTDVGKNKKKFIGERKSRVCSAEEFHSFRKKIIAGKKSVSHNSKSCGIPQGSSMSGLLANISMIDFDETVYFEVDRCGGKYWRYSDDIVVVLPAGVDVKRIDRIIRTESENKKLEVHGPEKSAKIQFSETPEGFASVEETLDYLGFSFNGKKILLRDKTMARFYRRMSDGVRKEIRRANKYGGRIKFKKLQNQFTHLGLRTKSRRNFLSYAKSAAKTTGSIEIKKQISRAMPILLKKIEKRKTKYKRWNKS